MSDTNKLTAENYALEQIEHYRKKADHNKSESIVCFRSIMICTLSAPLFVSLGEGVWCAKVVPSALSAIAAFSTAWLQLRKPQALWSTYRTAQRKIECSLTHYRFQIEDFDVIEQSEADKVLVSQVTAFASEAHSIWTKNIPETATLGENFKQNS